MRRVLLIVLGAACLAGCSRKPSTTVRVDPALATLIPSDTVLLTGVRVEALRATSVYKKYEPLLEKELNELSSKAGIDPRKNVWEIVAASNGKDSLVFARGKFSEMGLEPKLEGQGGKRSSYRGYTLIGSDEHVVAFLSPTTAAAGRSAAVKAMLDAKDQPKGGTLQSLIDEVQSIPSSNQIWAGGFGGGRTIPVPPSSNLDNLNRMILSVQRFSGGLDLNGGLKLNAEALCATAADAKRIHDAMRGFIGMGRLSTPTNQPEMLRFYDALKVSQDDTRVLVNADIPEDMLDSVMRMLQERRGSTSLPELPRPN
jgi:hypothetical protein